jgi:hypothetical protein
MTAIPTSIPKIDDEIGRGCGLNHMVRFRLSRLAQTDLAQILAMSAERWAIVGRRRHAAVLAAAMRKVAAEPENPTSRTEQGFRAGSAAFTCGTAENGLPAWPHFP